MISAMNPVKTTSVPSVEQQKAQAQEELDLAVQANVQYNKSNNITQTPKTTYTAPEPPSPPSFNENPKMYRNPAREVVNSVVRKTKSNPVKPTTYTAPESKMSIPNFNKWRGELSKTASKAPDLDLPDENQRNFAKGIFGDEEEKTAYNKMVYDIFAPPKTEEQLFIEGFEGVEDDEPDKMWKTEISENPDYTFKEPSKESVVVEKKPRTGLEQMLGQVKEKIDALAKTEYGYQPIKFVDGATVRDAQRAKYGKYLDVASDVLTAASVIPGIDTVTNAIQLPIDLVRGDFLGAGADLLGIIPFVGEIGDAAKTARLGAKVISRADDVSDLGRAAVKYGDELADTAHAASKADDAMGVIRGADGFADSVVIQGKRIDVNYLENNKARIAQSSPIDVPKDATAKVQRKNGYLQVKYEWSDGTYKYQSRWHTRNPGAPTAKESYWVTERRIPGKQYGKNMRAPVQEILVGDNQWISYADWDKAKSARRSGTLTKQQEEWLDNGHWTDFTQY